MSTKENTPSSPLARKLSTSMMRLFRAAPEVVAADYTQTDIKWSDTTAGDSRAERQSRRARNRIRNLNANAYDKSRRTRYYDYREMMDEVPEMSTALQVLVDFVFGGRVRQSLRVEFTDETSEQAKEVIGAAWRSVGGANFFAQVFREGTYLGDSFTELIYSKTGLIAERSLNPGLIDVDVNKYGQR